MKMNKTAFLNLSVIVIMSMIMGLSLTACGSSDDEGDVPVDPNSLSLMDDPDATRANDPKLASKAEKLNEDPESFYGTWISESADTENLYGNLEITIRKNGTFDANITGEDLHGKWHKIDGGIEYENEYFSGKIFYGPTCIMTFEEFDGDEEGDEDIQVVLVKKE